MAVPRSIRLMWLITLELARKYTRSLILGFFGGLLLSFLFWRIYPAVIAPLFHRADRIGMVGDFTPITLPLSIQTLISGGLTSLATDGSPLPALSSGWEATNSGKTFAFTIRNDLTWHNGKPVTAHDVNYNIRGVTLIPTGNDTLMAYLQYPYSPFPTLVSRPIFLPGLVGFGPYEVSGISLQGDAVKTLQLNPINLDKFRPKDFVFYQTEADAITAFKLGEVDTLEDLSTLTGLDHWGNIRVQKNTLYNRIVTLFYNMHDSELSDKKIRQGLAFGVPALPYERAYSPIPKTSWAYSDTVKKYMYDPTEAKKLIAHTGLATESATLTLSTFSQYLDTAQAIAASWTALGIKTTVRVENDVPASYQVLLSAQDVPQDPDQYLLWHSTQSQTNVTGYMNVKIDKLLEDGRQELDQNKRKTIYADFQRRLVEDAPAVFLYYSTSYTVSRQ